MRRVLVTVALSLGAVLAASPVYAMPYADFEGIWHVERVGGADNGRLTGRLLLLTDYGELNVDIRRTGSNDQDIVERTCNYVFRKGADTAEAQALFLIPNSSTDSRLGNSTAECASQATLQIDQVTDQTVGISYTDTLSSYAIALQHVLGEARHDDSAYRQTTAKLGIFDTTLLVTHADFLNTISTADSAYQHVQGRDLGEYSDPAWKYAVVYSRKPPIVRDNQREDDVDSIAAYFGAIAPGASYSGAETPLLLTRVLQPGPADKIAVTTLAAALKDKYGPPSHESAQGGSREMLWIHDPRGELIPDRYCPRDDTAMQVNTPFEFVTVGSNRISVNFSPAETCSVGAEATIRADSDTGIVTQMILHLFDHARMRNDAWVRFDLKHNAALKTIFEAVEQGSQTKIKL